MELAKAYLFCPRCGHKVSQEDEYLLICTHCHFKFYLSPLPCNAAIIENDEGKVLLVKRAVEPQKGYYDLPGGFIEPGEDFITSLKREINEELGCSIEVIKILGVYADCYLYQGITFPTLGIAAVCKLTSDSLKSADDISGYEFFQKSEVLSQKIAFGSVKQALRDYIE